MIDERPADRSQVDPERVRTRAEFVAALTETRERSGLTIRRLGLLVDTPPTTIHGWFVGRHLPYPRDNDLFRRVLTVLGVHDADAWARALARVRDAPGPTSRSAIVPYLGLRSYGLEDGELFFGRARLIAAAEATLGDMMHRLDELRVMFLVGASGSGKTSLLHAGLQARVIARGETAVSFRPGTAPVDALSSALAAGPNLILIDQFEELFTLCSDSAARSRFLDDLVVTCGPGGTASAVIALRADFFGSVASSPHLSSALQANQIVVGPLDRAELDECIVEPARIAGLNVEPELLARLRDDFMPADAATGAHTPGALPLLSHTLREIVAVCVGGSMKLADYRAVGGLDGAVERAAEAAFQSLTESEREAWRQLVPRLVTIDSNGTPTRRPISFAEIDERHDGGLLTMVDARIVTATAESIELTHEVILSAWPRLREWVEQDRAMLALRGEIANAADLWVQSERDPAALATGVRLSRVRMWDSDGHAALLTADERAFLDASVEHEALMVARSRRNTRRLRSSLALALVLALVAVVFGVVARRAADDAQAARDEALSRQLALRAGILRPTDPSLAAQLSVTAYRAAPTFEARSAVFESTAFARSSRLLGGSGSTALAVSVDQRRLALSNSVDGTIQLAAVEGMTMRRAALLTDLATDVDTFALAFSPDGSLLAAGGTDAMVDVWNVADIDHPEFLGSSAVAVGGSVFAIAFGDSNTDLYAGTNANTVRVDLSDLTSMALGEADLTTSKALALNATGDSLAVAGADGGVRLLKRSASGSDVWTETILAEPGESQAASVAFNPDSSIVAAGFRSRNIRLWDISDSGAPKEIDPPESNFTSWVNSLAFSADGTLFAAGSSDRTVRVWETANWTTVEQFELPDAVTNVFFLTDNRLLTSSVDGSARLWDLRDQHDPGLDSPIWTLGFDAAGDRFAAFADTAGIWDTSDPLHPRPLITTIAPAGDYGFSGVGAISPNGTLLAIGSGDGRVEIRDISVPDKPRLLTTLHDAEGLIESISFIGETALIAGGDDTFVRLYDITDLSHPVQHANPIDVTHKIVFAVAVTSDGQTVALTGDDNKVHILSIADPDHPTLLADIDEFTSYTQGVAFSPDGRFLAVGNDDNNLGIWDVTDPAHPQREGKPITGPHGSVFALTYSPDGTQLAASISDHSAWVWDVSTPASPRVVADLESPSGPVHASAFHPDGDYLVGAGADTDLRFWTIDTDAAITQLCGVVGDKLTADEWKTYVPGRSYGPACK